MEDGFIIEAAGPTDLPDIMELLEDINLDMEELHYSQFVLVRHKLEVIAAGRIRLHEDGSPELCSLGVAEPMRAKGLGSALVEALLNQLQGKPVWVVSEIPVFFARFGFTAAAEYPAVLQDKLQRCHTDYACTAALVLVHYP